MLDGKILTAVLASLAAIGTAMNGGDIDSSDLTSVKENPLSTEFDGLMPGSLGAFTEYMKNPKPDTDLDAEFKINDLGGQKLKVSSATLKSNNLTSIKAENRQITSKSNLSFHKFSGDVNLGQTTAFDGDAQFVLTNGVNISGGFEVNKKVNATKIELKNVERSEIDLKHVSGSIKSDSTSTNIDNDSLNLKINSFTGNITILPSSNKMKLEGRVDKLDAGSVSLD